MGWFDINWEKIEADARSDDPGRRSLALIHTAQFVEHEFQRQNIPRIKKGTFEQVFFSALKHRGYRLTLTKENYIRIAKMMRHVCAHPPFQPEPGITWFCILVWAGVWEALSGQRSGIPSLESLDVSDIFPQTNSPSIDQEKFSFVSIYPSTEEWREMSGRLQIDPSTLRRRSAYLLCKESWLDLISHGDNTTSIRKAIKQELGNYSLSRQRVLEWIDSSELGAMPSDIHSTSFFDWAAQRQCLSDLEDEGNLSVHDLAMARQNALIHAHVTRSKFWLFVSMIAVAFQFIFTIPKMNDLGPESPSFWLLLLLLKISCIFMAYYFHNLTYVPRFPTDKGA